MSCFFESFFDSNPYFNAASFLLAILGIVFSIYFYVKSQKKREPTYISRTVNLVRENIQKIDRINILYDGKAVDNLSITKIALWNNGKETIDCGDVAKKNPLRLSIKNDYIFLNAEVIYQKNTSNNFEISISEDHKYIYITFDYFDFEEGIVLQAFHTGNKSSDVMLEGQIKSVSQIRRADTSSSILSSFLINSLNEKRLSRKESRTILGWSQLIIGILSLIFVTFTFFTKKDYFRSDTETDRIIFVISFSLVGLLYLFMGYNCIKRYIPKGFDVFNEEFLKEKRK